MIQKKLIINADDFGMSRGITDGILAAYNHGIVTSTSLMVNMPATRYAARESKKYPKLSVGLHGVLPNKQSAVNAYIRELNQQLEKFISFMGQKPTHFDLHGVPPTTKKMAFAAFCFISNNHIPYRGENSTHVISSFYGMKKLYRHPNHINFHALQSILIHVKPGITTLVCHPGFTSNRLADPYRTTRNAEHTTLTNPAIFRVIMKEGIQLINFRGEVKHIEKNQSI